MTISRFSLSGRTADGAFIPVWMHLRLNCRSQAVAIRQNGAVGVTPIGFHVRRDRIAGHRSCSGGGAIVRGGVIPSKAAPRHQQNRQHNDRQHSNPFSSSHCSKFPFLRRCPAARYNNRLNDCGIIFAADTGKYTLSADAFFCNAAFFSIDI